VVLSSTSSRDPKTNKLPADSYHSAEITKASVHVEAYKSLSPNLALMLSDFQKFESGSWSEFCLSCWRLLIPLFLLFRSYLTKEKAYHNLFVFLKNYAEKQDNCTFNAEQLGRSNKDRVTSPSTLER